MTIHSWDIAATKDGDWTVCFKFGLAKDPLVGDVLYLTGIVRMRIELPDVREAIITQDTVDKPALILMDGNGIGLGVLQDLTRCGKKNILPGGAMERSNAESLKADRLRRAMLNLYDGRIRIPNAMTGLEGLLSELALFPDGKYDDQVDALSIVGAHMKLVIHKARFFAGQFGLWAPAQKAALEQLQRDQPDPPRSRYFDRNGF